MAVSITLKKWKEATTGANWNEVTAYPDVDISGYHPEEIEIQITKELEFDEVFNFICSAVQLTFIDNATFATEFTQANLQEFLYGIEIYKDATCRFVGKIDPESVKYEAIEDMWTLEAVDWFKYYIDKLKGYEEYGEATTNNFWSVLYKDLDEALRCLFMGAVSPGYTTIIQDVTILADAAGTDDWTYDADLWINAETPGIISEGAMTNYDLIVECQKHHGAYIYVDNAYHLCFVNRQKTTGDAGDISGYILDDTYETQIIELNKYDGILISQKTLVDDDPVTYEISWRLLYMVDGVLQNISFGSDEALDAAYPGMEFLDLRQKMGWNNSTNSRMMDLDYHLFAQRDFDDTYADYLSLVEPVEKKTFSITWTYNLLLLNSCDLGGATTYQVYKLTENLFGETTDVELLKIG